MTDDTGTGAAPIRILRIGSSARRLRTMTKQLIDLAQRLRRPIVTPALVSH